MRGRRRWPGKDGGKVVSFPTAGAGAGAEQEYVTPSQVFAYAVVSICAAISRVVARVGMETEREGDVGAVTSLVAAHNDLIARTRQTFEGK